jgi:hypothetical protein
MKSRIVGALTAALVVATLLLAIAAPAGLPPGP